MISVDLRDLIGGTAISAIGGAFWLGARGLPQGSPGQIGPGFVPSAVGLITVVLGIILVLRALRTSASFPKIEPRPVIAVFASVGAFGILIGLAGLIPALIATSAIAATGSPKSHPLTVTALAIAVSLACWIIFILALGLPMQAIRNPF